MTYDNVRTLMSPDEKNPLRGGFGPLLSSLRGRTVCASPAVTWESWPFPPQGVGGPFDLAWA